MPIRWKVVTWPWRKSCYCSHNNMGLTYPVGEKVEAIPGSIGIFVFRVREQAEAICYGDERKVIKVMAHGRGKSLVWRPQNCSEKMLHVVPAAVKRNFRVVSDPHSLANGVVPIDNFINGDQILIYTDDETMVYPAVTPLE